MSIYDQCRLSVRCDCAYTVTLRGQHRHIETPCESVQRLQLGGFTRETGVAQKGSESTSHRIALLCHSTQCGDPIINKKHYFHQCENSPGTSTPSVFGTESSQWRYANNTFRSSIQNPSLMMERWWVPGKAIARAIPSRTEKQRSPIRRSKLNTKMYMQWTWIQPPTFTNLLRGISHIQNPPLTEEVYRWYQKLIFDNSMIDATHTDWHRSRRQSFANL